MPKETVTSVQKTTPFVAAGKAVKNACRETIPAMAKTTIALHKLHQISMGDVFNRKALEKAESKSIAHEGYSDYYQSEMTDGINPIAFSWYTGLYTIEDIGSNVKEIVTNNPAFVFAKSLYENMTKGTGK